VVVLISGSGSNLQSLIDASQRADSPFSIAAVICNRPGAFGLSRAESAGIPAICLDHTGFDSREAFDEALAQEIDVFEPELIALAGFMRILTPAFVSRYEGRMLNIHPSLLPKYPGLNTHQRAIDAGDDEAGATIHFVTADLDGGPPVVQARVPIKQGDDASSLANGSWNRNTRSIHWQCNGSQRADSRSAHRAHCSMKRRCQTPVCPFQAFAKRY